METFETRSATGTLAFGRRFAKRLGRGDCVGLVGDLGAGKTVLVRGIAVGLGVDDQRVVSSPTYVLVKEYPATIRIYHADLYRLAGSAEEVSDLGLAEMLADGVVLIEWADRAGSALPRPRWQVRIEISGPSSRKFHVQRVD